MNYQPLPLPDLPENCDRSQIPVANETPPCPVCGNAKELIEVGTVGRFRMPVRNVVCSVCAMCFQSPRPDAGRMETYYSGAYREHYGDVSYPKTDGGVVSPGQDGFLDALECWHANQADNAIALGDPQAGEHVLEVGCRHARTLGIMKKKLGIVPHGIEPGPDEAREARESGIECFNGVLEDYDPGELRFDQVQLFHVLEHLHEPLDALIRLRSWLGPAGRIVVEVPNVYQPYGRLEGGFFQNAHLTNFSPSTLTELMRRAGLRVTKVVDSTSLFIVGEKQDVSAELPLPFDATLMPLSAESPEWVAACLQSYAELEDLRLFVLSREFNVDVLNLIVECVKKPCFIPHMINTVSQLTEELVKANAPQPALLIAQAARQGPHPPEIVGGLGKLTESIQKLMAAA